MLGFQNIEDRTRHGPHPKDMDFPYPSFLSSPLPFPLHPLSSLLFSSSPTFFCLPACPSHAHTVHTHERVHMHMLPVLHHEGGSAASSPTLNLSVDGISLLNMPLILLHRQANQGTSSSWPWMVKCKKTSPAP